MRTYYRTGILMVTQPVDNPAKTLQAYSPACDKKYHLNRESKGVQHVFMSRACGVQGPARIVVLFFIDRAKGLLLSPWRLSARGSDPAPVCSWGTAAASALSLEACAKFPAYSSRYVQRIQCHSSFSK